MFFKYAITQRWVILTMTQIKDLADLFERFHLADERYINPQSALIFHKRNKIVLSSLSS